jgi:hypothetical protein
MALSEIKTQIYLPKELFGSLKRHARHGKTSVAHVVREAIGAFLEEHARPPVNWAEDPITRSIGMAKGGDRDLSTHHDKYLYGWNKKSA